MALMIVLMFFLVPVLFVGAVAVAATIEMLCATGVRTSLHCCPEAPSTEAELTRTSTPM